MAETTTQPIISQSAPAKETFVFEIKHQEKYSRKQLLLRTFFGLFYIILPHAFVLIFIGLWSNILTAISWWIILFTEKYPKNFYEYQVKFMRWGLRVNARMFNLADGYPGFGLNKKDEAVTLEVAWPQKLSRGKLLLKTFLGVFMVIPHAFALWFRYIATLFLTHIAWWVVLFTGKYPKGWHEFNTGSLRWASRVNLYFGFMADEYPPFSGLSHPKQKTVKKAPAKVPVQKPTDKTAKPQTVSSSVKAAIPVKPADSATAKPVNIVADKPVQPSIPAATIAKPTAIPIAKPEEKVIVKEEPAKIPPVAPSTQGTAVRPPQGVLPKQAKKEEKKKGFPLLWILLTLLFLASSSFFGWKYFDLSEKFNVLLENEKKWNEDKAALEKEKASLYEQITNLNNENETLIAKMNSNSARIPGLIQENMELNKRIKQLQSSGGGSGEGVSGKERKELEALRKQVKELNEKLLALTDQNNLLAQEKTGLQTELTTEKGKTSLLEKDNKEMKQKMEEAKALVIDDLLAGGVKLKRGGKKIISLNKAKRSDKIQVCFSVGRNTLADKGSKDFYIVINAPGNKVLGKTEQTFELNGEQKRYSVKQTEDYRNKEKLVCAYYEKASEEKFETGKYKVEVFLDGKPLGDVSFDLK